MKNVTKNSQKEVKAATTAAANETTTAPAAQQPAAKPEATKPELEIVDIRECHVGDVIRYTSSKKPYIVAEETVKNGKPSKFLFSKTQQYDSTKESFEVVRLVKGDGKLPEKFEDSALNELLGEARTVVKSREEFRKLREAKAAEQKAKATAPATESVLATAEGEEA